MTPPSSSPLSPEAWERRYQEGSTPWDLGQAAPAFSDLLQAPTAPRPGATVVLGAGRGYDALLFAQAGFAVTAVDFAPSALDALTQQAATAQRPIQALQRDIFDLVPEYAGRFSYVVEHTCFCAIDPSLRPAYAQLTADLLAPQGELLAIFFTHNRTGGPPFGVSVAALLQWFEPYFEVMQLHPIAASVPARQGEEHFGRFRKK